MFKLIHIWSVTNYIHSVYAFCLCQLNNELQQAVTCSASTILYRLTAVYRLSFLILPVQQHYWHHSEQQRLLCPNEQIPQASAKLWVGFMRKSKIVQTNRCSVFSQDAAWLQLVEYSSLD